MREVFVLNEEQLYDILSNFNVNGKLLSVCPKTNGNINKTFIVSYDCDGEVAKFLFQKINTTVFTSPHKLMRNITLVTNYFADKLKEEGDDVHQPLKVIMTNDNKYVCTITDITGEKQYFRMYNYINNSVSYDNVHDPVVVRNAGRAFAHFQRLLLDYPMDEIEETIPSFHDTLKRYKQFMKDVKTDAYGRCYSVAKEIVFLLKREHDCSLIVNKIMQGKIPLHVIHNDTKVNNVMFNKDNGEFLTVIDLDTVMPGYVGFDYGDGVRSAASYVKEDDPNLDAVGLDMELFKAYTDGYLEEIGPYLTSEEVNLLGESIKIITLELGMRFLNDYINGDTYFKTDYSDHNLVRARNQFKLVADIENKEEEIEEYIQKVYKKTR